MKITHQVAPPDPSVQPTMTVEAAALVYGIARASAYEGVRTGEIPSIRVGRRILIPTAAVRRQLGLNDGGGLNEPTK
jgi:excisionase family DNA binding protein